MWIDDRGSTVLPRPECLRLLAVAAKAEGVGRLGISTATDEAPNEAPIVVPVNFRFHDGEVLVRLGAGFLSGAADGRLVAFEVDRVDRSTGEAWSVLVRGLARLLVPPEDQLLEATARPLVPEPGDLAMTVRPDLVTGRRFGLH
jgi:pyridoxamine 5'-phosphate oxidase-like protein